MSDLDAFHGPNAGYVLDLYDRYLESADSVGPNGVTISSDSPLLCPRPTAPRPIVQRRTESLLPLSKKLSARRPWLTQSASMAIWQRVSIHWDFRSRERPTSTRKHMASPTRI